MSVTIQQIADRAGVSRGTVDRAINHRGRIDPDVSERILKIADEMGYVPKNRKARVKRAFRIGVVTQLAKYSFMSEVNRGLETAAKELKNRNVEILVEEGFSVDEKEQLALIDKLVDKGVDALAIMPVDCEAVRVRMNELAEAKNLPIVTFNTDIVGTRRMAFVGMDNLKSGETAAGLMGMLTRGSGKILVILGFFGNQVNSERVEGFVREVKRSYPGIEIAGVQSGFDDAKEVEKIIVNSMLGIQTIDGILIVSAGQSGTDRAFQRLKLEHRPYIITYDLTPWSRKALQDGKIDFLIDQNCYLQGYKSLWILADYLMNDEQPEGEYVRTDISIKTRYNI